MRDALLFLRLWRFVHNGQGKAENSGGVDVLTRVVKLFTHREFACAGRWDVRSGGE